MFHRGVPKEGEFCDVMRKPPPCLSVDFEKRILDWEGVQYPLQLRTRTEFLFPYGDVIGEIWVMTENRVELRFPNQTPRFYLRKKDKYRTEKKSNE